MSLDDQIRALVIRIAQDIAQLASSGGGGGIADAPSTGVGFVRKDAAWAEAFPAGGFDVPTSATVSAPPAGLLRLFSREVGGRKMLGMIGPSGLDTTLQPSLSRNTLVWARPLGGSTAITYMGMTLTAVGTATSASVALTNLHQATKGIEYAVTTAAATAVAGWRETVAKYAIGHAFGGFHYVCRFGPSRGVAADATRRVFVGFTSINTAPTDVDPSTLTNVVGVGCDAADANYKIMYRNGSGTVVKVDTGIPKATADNTALFELAMFNAPGSPEVKFEFTNLVTGAKFTHSTTTSLPTSTTLLVHRGAISVGGTSSVIGISLVNLTIETDY